MKKYLLTEEEKKRIKLTLQETLSKRLEVIFAYLYGSFVLPIPCSDIDIAVFPEESAFTAQSWEYEANLSAYLERKVGLPVDVLTLNCAPMIIRYHVTRGELLFTRNEPVRFNFLENTWREYFDFQPVLRRCYDDLLGG